MVVLVTFPVWLLLGPLLCLALCLRWARRRSRPKDNARDRSDLEWELKIELPTESPDCLLGVPKESHAKEPLALPRAPLEHKFGAPRSELYKIEYYPIDEDTSSLIQAAIRDESQHQKLEEKLQQLSLLCRHFPASGWVQPQDPRVLLRPQCCDNARLCQGCVRGVRRLLGTSHSTPEATSVISKALREAAWSNLFPPPIMQEEVRRAVLPRTRPRRAMNCGR